MLVVFIFVHHVPSPSVQICASSVIITMIGHQRQVRKQLERSALLAVERSAAQRRARSGLLQGER